MKVASIDFGISRRNLLVAGTAAGLLPLSLGRPAGGEEVAAAARANAAHYHFRIGNISATVVSDGFLTGSPEIYAGNAPEDELKRVLGEAFLPTERFVLNLNTLLLELDGRKVLIDAGAAQTFGPDGGRIFSNLAAIGVRPEDIDAIVITHTHPDHVGNLRSEDGGAAFANATVYVPEADWAFFFTNEPDLSHLPMPADFRRRFIENIKRSLEPVAATRILYAPGTEILPGLATVPASGHTPGMTGLLVHSGADQLLITSDAAYSPLLNMENPWRPGPDVDAAAAAVSRRRLFDRAAADRMLVLGFHFPFPGLGHIRADGEVYRWVPVNWHIGL